MKGNFKHIVMLPKYADVMEWVAVNSMYLSAFPSVGHAMTRSAMHSHYERLPPVFDFYQNLNQFYGVLAECCTQQSCPTMSAGPTYVNCRVFVNCSVLMVHICLRLNYTWINQDRKSVQLPAPTYIDYVMTWVQNLLDDENVFPTKSGTCLSKLS